MATKSSKGSSAQTELVLLGKRSTLSPEEALRYLCLRTTVDVAVDALWAHVLGGDLPIAIEFNSHSFGRRGRVVAHAGHHAITKPELPLIDWDTFDLQPPAPPQPAVRQFSPGLVLELDGAGAERLEATWDLCQAGDWQAAVRRLRHGEPSFGDTTSDFTGDHYASVLVAQPGEHQFAWELCSSFGDATRTPLEGAHPVFRLDALEQFLSGVLEPAAEELEYKGQLSITTLLQMVGALIAADGSRKNVLSDLREANIRGFGQRNLDKYLAAASEEYEKARPAGIPETKK